MKKITTTLAVFFLFAVIATVPAQAQTESKAAFEKTLVNDFCDTFSKVSPTITKDNMTAQLGLLILPLFSKYSDQIEKEWKLYASDPKDIRTIGEKIGQLAAVGCPAFQEFIKSNINEIVNERSEGEAKTFAGKLLKVEGTPFTYLQVQNSQGRTDRFYWLEFFPGADKLSASKTAYLNKPLRITYKEMEIFQAATGEYRTIKVITNVVF